MQTTATETKAEMKANYGNFCQHCGQYFTKVFGWTIGTVCERDETKGAKLELCAGCWSKRNSRERF